MNEPRIFGPYTLLRRLAVGGMAEIHVAKTRGLGGFEKLVALKLVHPHLSADPHFVRMLIAEAKTVSMLAHANIAQVYDLGCIDDTHFIAMEYVDGLDVHGLANAAKQLGERLPLAVTCHIVAEMLNGLDYAHRKRDGSGRPLNLVHRDISPQNVMVNQAGEVKLVDFGIAKSSLQSERTEVGVIKGKYYYMSPEQAWGDPTDRRSDVFSAGILLHEMLTGQMVYRGTSIPQLIARVREAQVADPRELRSDVPSALASVVMTALARDPRARFQSAIDMGEALRDVQYGSNPTFSPARLSDYVMRILEGRARAATVAPAQPSTASEAAVLLSFDAPPVTRREALPERSGRRPSGARAPSIRPPPRPPTQRPAAMSSLAPAPLPFDTVASGFARDADDPTQQWTTRPQLGGFARSWPELSHPVDDSAPTTRHATLSPAQAQAIHPGGRAAGVHTPALVPPPSGDIAIETIPPTPPLPDFSGHRQRGWLAWAVAAACAIAGAALFHWVTHARTYASLELVSAPAGASVRVDGKPQGTRTPLKLNALVPGRAYDVVVDAPGYRAWTGQLRVDHGSLRQIIVLKPLTGRVVVRSSPAGAEVLLDGASMGQTPLALEDVGVTRTLHLTLRRAGYRDVRRDVQLRDDALEATVDVPLVGSNGP